MKTNKIFRIAAILLMAVVLTTCVIGSTFAKYTTAAPATETSASVAKWDVKITKDGSTPISAFDLFTTIKEADGLANETDVKSGKIAPGTSGEFQFKIKNDSDVTANCKVTFNVTNANNIPIEFSVNNGEYGTLTTYNVGDLAIGAEETTVTVKWRWAFTGNDGDTDLGTAGTATVTVGATITAEQVD